MRADPPLPSQVVGKSCWGIRETNLMILYRDHYPRYRRLAFQIRHSGFDGDLTYCDDTTFSSVSNPWNLNWEGCTKQEMDLRELELSSRRSLDSELDARMALRELWVYDMGGRLDDQCHEVATLIFKGYNRYFLDVRARLEEDLGDVSCFIISLNETDAKLFAHFGW